MSERIRIDADGYEDALAQLADLLLADTKGPFMITITSEDKRWKASMRVRRPKAKAKP